jgi:hypothetical protein
MSAACATVRSRHVVLALFNLYPQGLGLCFEWSKRKPGSVCGHGPGFEVGHLGDGRGKRLKRNLYSYYGTSDCCGVDTVDKLRKVGL